MKHRKEPLKRLAVHEIHKRAYLFEYRFTLFSVNSLPKIGVNYDCNLSFYFWGRPIVNMVGCPSTFTNLEGGEDITN